MTGFETLAALLLADDEEDDQHRARRLRGSLQAPSAEASAWMLVPRPPLRARELESARKRTKA